MCDNNQLKYESIAIELTKQCNLRCPYCYAQAQKSASIASIDREVLLDFLLRFKNNGGRRVLLTGGEVMLLDDIRNIVARIKTLGLMVDMFSNGTLITEKDAAWIAQDINLINISLDGNRVKHDALRGKGNYDRTVSALKHLGTAGAAIALQCMVTKEDDDNYYWLREITDICHPKIVKLSHVSNVGRGKTCEALRIADRKWLKDKAGELSGKLFNYHIRVVTNIIDRNEWAMYYQNGGDVLAPWMMSDGRILTCYVDDMLDYWTISSADIYPNIIGDGMNRKKALNRVIMNTCDKRQLIDIMELSRDLAVDMARQNT